MRRAIRYFFPKRPIRERLPLPTKRLARQDEAAQDVQADIRNACRLLVAAGVARSLADAQRLLGKYPSLTYRQIIRRERRRRRNQRLRTFLRRLKKFLIGAVLIAALIMPSAARAQDDSPIGTARVIAQALNVRAEPSAASAKLGVLRRGKTVKVYEVAQADDGGTWLRLQCPRQACWINGSAKYVRLNLTQDAPILNRVETLTAELSAASWTIAPAVPRPNQPFTITLIVSNRGNQDAAPFSIGANAAEQFGLATVNGLDAASQGTVQFQFIAPANTGAFEVNVALDLDNAIEERDKRDNLVKIVYRVDAPLRTGTLSVAAYSNVDLDGDGLADLSWNGAVLEALKNGAQIQAFDGKLSEVHADLIEGIEGSKIAPSEGAIALVRTANGERAWLRIAATSPLLEIQYGVYGR
jgi:hypothetical protein